MNKTTTYLLIMLIMTVFLISCTQQSAKPKDRFSQTRPPKIAILDFYNQTEDADLNNLGITIADKLQGDLSFNYSVYDTTYIRNYVKKEGYTRADLYNTNKAKAIGEDIGVDFVVRGSYSKLGNEIMVIVRFTPIVEGYPTYQYEYSLDQDNMFDDLNLIAEEIQETTKEEIPDIEENTREQMEKAAEESVSNPVKVEQIVETYVSGGDINVGKPQEIDPAMIDYEEPSPRPNWVMQKPSDPNKVYFVGQAFDQDTYYKALEVAVEDAYYQMSMAIGTKVESSLAIQETSQGSTMDSDTSRKMQKDLLITTLANVRNVQREQTYYAIKSTNNKYSVSVLYSMDRDVLQELIAESVEMEKQRREKEIARINRDIELAENEAEIQALQDQINSLQQQMDGYEKIIAEKDNLVANVDQESVRHQYQPSSEDRSIQQETTMEDEVTIESDAETYYPYSTAGWITFGLGAGVAAAGGALVGVAAGYDSKEGLQDYQANPTASTWDEYNSDRQTAQTMEISGWTLLGAGGAAMVTGTVLLLITEEPPQNTSFNIIPTEDGAMVEMSHRF